MAIDDAKRVERAMRGEDLRGQFAESLGRNIAELLLDVGIARTCLNCDYWNTDGSYGMPVNFNNKYPEGCTLFKQLPPPKVIVKGCDKHTDQIPF